MLYLSFETAKKAYVIFGRENRNRKRKSSAKVSKLLENIKYEDTVSEEKSLVRIGD